MTEKTNTGQTPENQQDTTRIAGVPGGENAGLFEHPEGYRKVVADKAGGQTLQDTIKPNQSDEAPTEELPVVQQEQDQPPAELGGVHEIPDGVEDRQTGENPPQN